MRNLAILLLAATSLSACGGGGDAQSVSANVAVPGQVVTGTGTTAAPGSGTGVTAGSATSSTNTPAGTFLEVSTETSFNAVGSVHTLSDKSGGVIYAGNASTVRAPSGTISYNPRDGIFTLKVADTKANASIDMRYQDPAHRADFSGVYKPTFGVPNLIGFNYIEALGPGGATKLGVDLITFFYQRPGNSTNFVSLAGYVRDNTATDTRIFERGVFVFGTSTPQGQIPATGTASYTGGFAASMVNNPTLATASPEPTYFQWITGNSTVGVDFARSSLTLGLTGQVGEAVSISGIVPANAIAAGSTFTASGTAILNFAQSGGFSGVFQNAQFVNRGVTTSVAFQAVNPGNSVAGASSIDGAFYGPNAVNVGGNFRIIGGIPNQRIDILGAFAGAKK